MGGGGGGANGDIAVYSLHVRRDGRIGIALMIHIASCILYVPISDWVFLYSIIICFNCSTWLRGIILIGNFDTIFLFLVVIMKQFNRLVIEVGFWYINIPK